MWDLSSDVQFPLNLEFPNPSMEDSRKLKEGKDKNRIIEKELIFKEKALAEPRTASATKNRPYDLTPEYLRKWNSSA
jgi:hypothetical protein